MKGSITLLSLELHTHISGWVPDISSRMWNRLLNLSFLKLNLWFLPATWSTCHLTHSVWIHSFPVSQAPLAILDTLFHVTHPSEIPLPNCKLFELSNPCIRLLLLPPQICSNQGSCCSFLTDISAAIPDLLQVFPQKNRVTVLKYLFEFVIPLLKLCHESPFH